MLDVASELKLCGRRDPKTDILHALRSWLRGRTKERWLVVLDNVDDASFLLDPLVTSDEARHTPRRIDYIPMCDHGSVLITTRSKGEALKLVDESGMIEILPMSEDEAEKLLEDKLGQSTQGVVS